MKKLKKIIPIFVLALLCLAVAGAIIVPDEVVTADMPPNNPHYFYGSVTTLAGENVPYDPAAPTDPAQTTMVYARDITRVLNFDGLDEYSSGEYFGRPVSRLEGTTVYGYDPLNFAFPVFEYDDPSVQGARPGDVIQFYICSPGRELPGVLVTDPETGLPVQVYYELGGLNAGFDLSADVVPPAPEAVSPLEGALDVPKDEPITILFDEDITLVNLAAFHIEGSTSGDLLDGEPILGEDGRTVTLPHLDFDDFGEAVTVTIDAGAVSDGVGNLNAAYSWSFEAYPYYFTISGFAGVAEAVLHYRIVPEEPLEVIADGEGNYVITVPNGWSGVVTPVLEGYVFDPAFRSYTEVTADQPDQDYTATLLTFTISGNAGVEGVELQDGGGAVLATSDAVGDYSFTVDYGWSGVVTPVLEGYLFIPASRSYENVTEDLADQNYTPALEIFTISGNAGVAGAVLHYSILPEEPLEVIADGEGNYVIEVPYGWSGTVTPELEGYLFDPASRSYDNVTEDLADQDYTATVVVYYYYLPLVINN
jgi:hypothetical protein